VPLVEIENSLLEGNTMRKSQMWIVLLLLVILMSACSAPNNDLNIQPEEVEKEQEINMTQTAMDLTYQEKEGIDVIYLAGGCFWGMEKLMQSISGVVNVVSGYANGSADLVPTYDRVIQGDTGYRETVRVEYDPSVVSLDALLFAYFHVIDPTIENAQGNDRGTQYQTGVYYADDASRETVERIAAIERERTPDFVVEIESLDRFYDAEEYHQDYLDKNPFGYCHISPVEMEQASQMVVDPGNYQRPSDEEIRMKLTDLQYEVTQNAGTERPFSSELYENIEPGIYVDIVTGEPLFSSNEKFASGTGWPSYTAPIDENTIRYIEDNSLGMRRVEVRSRAGNSHLGHVFYDDPSSPTGTRFCINGAALRFIPVDEMENEGYGYLLDYVQ